MANYSKWGQCLCLLLCLTASPLMLSAQQSRPWQDDFWQWVEADEGDAAQWEEAFDQLTELENHPINLNSATREQLERLPFLSARQVGDLLEYVYRNKAMLSLSELLLVKSIGDDVRRLLLHFVCVAPVERQMPTLRLDSALLRGDNTLSATVSIPFYTRKGYRDGYLGKRYAHTVRYQHNYRDRLKVGFTAAQDAGEPFFSDRNKMGYDHYSYYLQLNHLGRIDRLCLGMYRVQMGMGLIMNGAFAMGKTMMLQSAMRSSADIRAYSSRSVANYLQGAALTMRLSDHWRTTVFGSYRPLDATLNDDGTVRTLLTSGYHRLPAEMDKKHNTYRWDAGGSVGWHGKKVYVNGNFVYSHFDRTLDPDREGAPFRRYQAAGATFANMSVDYGYTGDNISLAGEAAINRHGHLALLHRATWHPATSLTFSAIHRYYDKQYTALHARSFSEGGKVQNEHGMYVGMEWRPSWRFLLKVYADYAHFAWARYQVSASSDAFDTKVACEWKSNNWMLDGYYRLHLTQRDNAEKTTLYNRYNHRLRLRLSRAIGSWLSWQTQFDGTSVSIHQQYWGYMGSQQLTWKRSTFRLSGRMGYFHTNSYESRLYQYEPSLRYDFYFPAFYGEGIRYSFLASATIANRLMLTAKLGVTDYFDRSKIGSGKQEICHSSQPDLQLQMEWKF